MSLEIIDAKQLPLTDDEIKAIIEIESQPKVMRWLTEPVDEDLGKEFQSYKRFFKNLRKNRLVEILVSKSNGRIVGFLGLWNLGIFMEHVASIGISVHPDYWGQGIGKRLIDSAIKLAEKKGIKRLEIETLSENTSMRRLAEESGFKLECLRKDRIKKDGKFYDETAYFLLL